MSTEETEEQRTTGSNSATAATTTATTVSSAASTAPSVHNSVSNEKTTDDEYEKQKSKTSQNYASATTPGAVPMKSNSSAEKKLAKQAARRSRAKHGIDDGDTASPEEMSVATSRPRREEATPSFVQPPSDLESDEQHPGAMPVAGMGSSNNNNNNNNNNRNAGDDESFVQSTITDPSVFNNGEIIQGYNQAAAAPPDLEPGVIAARLVSDDESFNVEERERIIREAQEDVINKAVKAEISEEKDYRKWYICACLTTVVLIAIVVGSVVGTRDKRFGQAVLENSFCEEARPIVLDGDGVRGSIARSIPTEVTTCAFGEDDTSGQLMRGRWFSFVGSGNAVTASTCFNTNFNTRISIFSGSSCANDDLMCIDGNENNPTACCAVGNPDCEQRSAVTWSALEGQQYFIYVHGANADEVGNFELKLTASRTGSNNFCDGAVRVVPNGVSVAGSNELATVDNVATCGQVTQSGPGVWYEVVGVGGTMAASTCDGTSTSLMDTQITVLSGSCGEAGGSAAVANLQCVAANDNDACGGIESRRSRVLWDSVQNEIYHIYVHSNFGARGTFLLSVEPITVVQEGGTCLDINTQLYNTPGIGDAIEDLNESFLSSFDPGSDCTITGSEFVCALDLSEYDTGVPSVCLANGGRFIEVDIELVCEDGVFVLQMLNFPNCVSSICTNEFILNLYESQFDVAIATLSGQGISCTIGDLVVDGK